MNEYIYTIINKLLSELHTVYKYQIQSETHQRKIWNLCCRAVLCRDCRNISPPPGAPPPLSAWTWPCGEGRPPAWRAPPLEPSRLPTRRKTRPAPAHCSVFSRSSETKNFNIILYRPMTVILYTAVYTSMYTTTMLTLFRRDIENCFRD